MLCLCIKLWKCHVLLQNWSETFPILIVDWIWRNLIVGSGNSSRQLSLGSSLKLCDNCCKCCDISWCCCATFTVQVQIILKTKYHVHRSVDVTQCAYLSLGKVLLAWSTSGGSQVSCNTTEFYTWNKLLGVSFETVCKTYLSFFSGPVICCV